MLENNTPEIVFDLAQFGNFKSLSNEQQNIVSQYLSEQEFDNIYLLSSNMQDVLSVDISGLQPNPQIRQNLIAKFPSKSWNFDFLRNMFNYKIPVYRLALGAAAAYVALFIITPMFEQSNPTQLANTPVIQIDNGEHIQNARKSFPDITYGKNTNGSTDEFEIFTGASMADDGLLKQVLEVRD